MESGVYSFLHQNCHHQLLYAKFNPEVWYSAIMNARYGIINMQMLTKSNEQLNNCIIVKNHLEILTSVKWSFYSIRQLLGPKKS